MGSKAFRLMDVKLFKILQLLSLCEGGNLNAAVEAGWLDLESGEVTASGLDALTEFHKPLVDDWYFDHRGRHVLRAVEETAVVKLFLPWQGAGEERTLHRLQWFSDWNSSKYLGRAIDYPLIKVADFLVWVLGISGQTFRLNKQPVSDPASALMTRGDILEVDGVVYPCTF